MVSCSILVLLFVLFYVCVVLDYDNCCIIDLQGYFWEYQGWCVVPPLCRRFEPFLNGCNGEATNTDDLDNQVGRRRDGVAHANAVRNNREARNHRFQRNPGAARGGQPTFQNLLEQYTGAQRAMVQARRDGIEHDMQLAIVTRNAIMADVRRLYPDRADEVQNLPEPEVPMEIVIEDPPDDVFVNLRIYIVPTIGPKFPWLIILVCVVVMLTLLVCIGVDLEMALLVMSLKFGDTGSFCKSTISDVVSICSR